MELPYGCGALHGCRANGFMAENGDPTSPLIPARTKNNSFINTTVYNDKEQTCIRKSFFSVAMEIVALGVHSCHLTVLILQVSC